MLVKLAVMMIIMSFCFLDIFPQGSSGRERGNDHYFSWSIIYLRKKEYWDAEGILPCNGFLTTLHTSITNNFLVEIRNSYRTASSLERRLSKEEDISDAVIYEFVALSSFKKKESSWFATGPEKMSANKRKEYWIFLVYQRKWTLIYNPSFRKRITLIDNPLYSTDTYQECTNES